MNETTNNQISKFETLSLLFGIISILTGCCCLGGLFGITGIVFFLLSNKYIGTTKKNTSGLIASIIGITLSLIILIIAIVSPSSDNTAYSTTEMTIESNSTENATESITESNSIENTTETTIEENYDELQKLFLSINENMTYSEALESVISTGLPYTEEKYTGSRIIQVAFTENNTVQSYATIDGDYLEIIYEYPNDENSLNDEIEKYALGTLAYTPYKSNLRLISHYAGYYFSYYEKGNYISKLGTNVEIDNSISKKELLDYYIKNK